MSATGETPGVSYGPDRSQQVDLWGPARERVHREARRSRLATLRGLVEHGCLFSP